MSTQSATYTARAQGLTLADAYAECRAIARREAKNFYYAFLALPATKRDAMCAVYAFMRHADDLADDESLAVEVRRERLDAWLRCWHEVLDGGGTEDSVFIALADTRARYNIPPELLDKLVAGTAMDLEDAPPVERSSTSPEVATYATYETFNELYRYCYLVASVVGLVCIRIFGYQDPSAEKLAEETGIAFQLTNILRDVREDAERGRLYLPLEDLATYGVSPSVLTGATRAASHGFTAPELRRLLAFEALRAERFYKAGGLLLPRLEPDSRPALWVVMTTYRTLLRRIGKANYDVFSKRIRVPSYLKWAILARGLLLLARLRLTGY